MTCAYRINQAIARLEEKTLSECDEGSSFCDMLQGWLDQHQHWKRNGYGLDLHNQVSDLISETRGEIEKAQISARQTAVDTVGDSRRDAAA